MNLLKDKWLPVIRHDCSRIEISPAEIARLDVADLAETRPDFQGALYQFLIGLLQTTFAPAGLDEWEQYWTTPPPVTQLSAIFLKFSPVFELFSSIGEPAFLQDLNMPEGEEKSVAALLIEAPGGKTLKDNLDHFIKGGRVECACAACAATALFTLQTNAPAGGVGHRVGLRGGGPLTTLVLPSDHSASLWQKLWLNVLTEEEFEAEKITTPQVAVFPWMADTRVSDKPGSATLPEDAHRLQMYWGMPRRIRLKKSSTKGICSLCGKYSEALVTHFSTKNYGVNYEGHWQHPLTPYRLDIKHEKPPLSLKGQQGGLGYRHWLGLNWVDDTNGDHASRNIKSFNAEKYLLIHDEARLWCFGYDMDNMKARCWYEAQMPVLSIPKEHQTDFLQLINSLLMAARDTVKELRGQVKAAWFKRPQDVKGDTSMIDASFWQSTEASFYVLIHQLSLQPQELRFMPEDIGKEWVVVLRRQARELFDYWVLEGDAEDMDMKRIMKAKRILLGKLNSLKSLATLDKADKTDKEVA